MAETTKQLKLSQEIQLDATEMVRRAERGVGIAIRKGQEEGNIRPSSGGDTRTDLDRVVTYDSVSPTEFASKHDLTNTHGGIYDMTDNVSDAAFDVALSEAKEEGNLSRANVVRKLKGEQSSVNRRKKLSELAAQGYSSRQIAEMTDYSSVAWGVPRAAAATPVTDDAPGKFF